jgi:hypothetical protein
MDLSFHSFPGRVPGRNEEVRGQDLEDLKGSLELMGNGGMGKTGELPRQLTPSLSNKFFYILKGQ